ncbi:sialate O-acetylesterase [Roseateles asaccharophilus]|uniref:Sialate O-acetylesterase n=1 Tax=Roseateles asaccharophilus TaxID=582607 RepID=A0ABU2A224_9BURK|nr:sialate O-acetylesterase [Roseateles asaccharophilus]MDR7331244.1 sialate O-acetylesterase [Roseateles asaccharophilus]
MTTSKFRLPLLLLALAAASAQADVRLATVFGEHMVLQREQPIRLWGWAAPGKTLAVELAGKKASATAGADGRWAATLPALKAGGPHRLSVSGDGSIELKDVLIGDVWLLGGQSNMEWPLAQTDTGAQEIASPQNAQLRHLRVPLRASLQPEANIAPASWVVAEAGSVADFSAVGYHFARQMQAVQGVPIGLLNTAWGGSHLETWMRRELTAQDPALAAAVKALPATGDDFVRQRRDLIEGRVKAWQPGLAWGVDASAWSATGDIDTDWPTLKAPGVWEGQGLPDVDGIVWLRRKIELSAAQAAGAAQLLLAKVDDCDEVWVNGQKVGGQCGYDQARAYALPAGVLRAGANWIAVRVTDTGGGGGFDGDAAALRLDTAAGAVSLAGTWRARVEQPRVATAPTANDAPTLAHNGLIAPLQGLSFRGVLWYQGESNTGRAAAYAGDFQKLIADWRAQFHNPKLPFFFVQLASFLPLQNNRPGQGGWAELRDAQSQALKLPHTGMAVAIDVGDAVDIHPRNKRALGHRLSQLALHELGLRAAPATGPQLAKTELRGAEVWLHFKHTAGGLRTAKAGEPLRGFLLAGADRRFVPATARIVGDAVVLSSADVKSPQAARYAWVDNPSESNLTGADGLPAAPLRSDAWPLQTAGKLYPN